jgi:DNA-binding XRE family transcriptional regulator
MSEFDGLKLKKIRKEAGYTQKQVADRVGLSRETVSAIENNQPAAIRSLEMSIIKKWWGMCKPSLTQIVMYQFKSYLAKYFSID